MPRLTVTDRIAMEAARLYAAGEASTVRDAVALAAERLGLDDGPLPGEGRVRQHIQAREMQRLGDDGYRAGVAEVFRAVEHLMTALVEGLDDAEPMLVGRAARGHVDGDLRLHVRVYTEQPIDRIAAVLVGFGHTEPQFATADTRFGRLSRLILSEDDRELVVTRCLPAMRPEHRRCLFTRRPIETASRSQVQELIDALERG